jgi:hypothetical protein
MTQTTSRAGKVVRGLLYAVFALGVVALSVFSYLRYWPRETPAGQPALQTMTPELLVALKESFNAASLEAEAHRLRHLGASAWLRYRTSFG